MHMESDRRQVIFLVDHIDDGVKRLVEACAQPFRQGSQRSILCMADPSFAPRRTAQPSNSAYLLYLAHVLPSDGDWATNLARQVTQLLAFEAEQVIGLTRHLPIADDGPCPPPTPGVNPRWTYYEALKGLMTQAQPACEMHLGCLNSPADEMRLIRAVHTLRERQAAEAQALGLAQTLTLGTETRPRRL